MDITSHPVYSQLLRFLNSSNSREKLLRLVQYWLRTLNARGAGYKSQQQAIMMARKPLRAFKALTHLRNIVRLLGDEIMDPVLKWFSVLKELFLGIYFTIDSAQWLQLLGVYKTQRNVKRSAGLAWSTSLTFGLLCCIRQWQMYPSRTKTQVEKLKRETVKTLLDIPIAYSSVSDWGFDDAHLGVFGVVTSFMALQDLWKSAA